MTVKVIGDLVVRIGGDTKGLVDAVSKADGSLKGIERTAMNMSKVVAGAIAGAALALVALTSQSLKTVDAQLKLAERMDSSVVAVQTLTYAANLAGIGMEQMMKSADMLNRKLGEAIRDGMSPASDALKRLGLNARDLSKMDADQRFAAIADAIKRAGLNGAQTADVLRQLGIRGAEFNNLMRKGGEEIRNARKDVVDFGVAVSDVDAKQIEIANDAVTTMGLVATGAGNQLATALSPAIQAVVEYISGASRETGGFRAAIEDAVGRAVRVFGDLKSVWHQTRLEWDAVIAGILDGVNWIIRAWNKIANTIPGMSKMAVDEISHDYGKLREQIGDPPSDADWAAWWEAQKKKSQEAAQAAVDAQKKLGRDPQGGEVLSAQERKQLEEKFHRLQESIANEDRALALQREKQIRDLEELHRKGIAKGDAYNAARLQIEDTHQLKMRALIQSRLEEGILTEQELLRRKHELQLEEIRKFEENKTISAQRANELRRLHAEQHAIAIAQITARQYSALAGIVDTSMGHISAIMGSEGGKQFRIMKAISTATAIVKGYEAAVSAYAAGNATGIPGMGAIMSAVSLAGTGALIAKIHGAGQNTASTSAAVSSSPAAAPQPAPQNSYMIVRGIDRNSLYSGDAVRQLAERLLEYQRDGGQVVIQ